jgi:RHS repeat-associated protein
MTHSKGASIFADYDWMFDEANRMTRFESLIDGVADYTNDDTGQLTGAEYTAGAGLPTAPPEYTAGAGLPTAPPDEQYVYDENGNRINNGYAVGPNNQLLSDGTHTYTYDEEGNRTSRTNIATAEVTEYHWDHRNRLVRVSTRATANGPLTTDIHYAYDFGQRWVRKVFNPGEPDERSTIFVHDGGDEQNPLILHPIRPPQIVLHFGREGAGDAGETDLAHRYLWGPNVDQILADENLDSSQPPALSRILWPLTDHLNTVRDLATYNSSTDTTTIVSHLIYDAFGNIVAQTDPTIGTLFLFTARPFDKDTRLQNNLNRWYDANAKRWMTEDPLGFEARDRNLQRYVGNMPLAGTDAFGLQDSRRAEYFMTFGAGLKAKFVVFVSVAQDGRLGVNAHIRRFTEQFGDVERYRQRWNSWCSRLPEFEHRGLVWSEGREQTGWAMPNLSLFLDGTDEANAYGGSYTIGEVEPTFDINGDLVNRGRPGKFYPDDDYMVLRVKTYLASGKECDSGETKAWQAINGGRGLNEVVHLAGSAIVYVTRPDTGKIEIELEYADGKRNYGKVTIPLGVLGGTGLGNPTVEN